MVETPAGTLTFQDYFVRRQQKDDVTGIRFDGIESAMPAPGVMDAIKNADSIILCPSNPIVSIGPILNVPGIRDACCIQVRCASPSARSSAERP